MHVLVYCSVPCGRRRRLGGSLGQNASDVVLGRPAVVHGVHAHPQVSNIIHVCPLRLAQSARPVEALRTVSGRAPVFRLP